MIGQDATWFYPRFLRDALKLYGCWFDDVQQHMTLETLAVSEFVRAARSADTSHHPHRLYVEGLVCFPGGTVERGAWDFDTKTKQVIDPFRAFWKGDVTYLGVPFKRTGVRASIKAHTGYDNWLGILSAQHVLNRSDDPGLVSFIARYRSRKKSLVKYLKADVSSD